MARRSRQTAAAPHPAPERATRDRRNRWIALALAVAACLLYSSTLRNGFVGDDALVILNNAWTREGVSALPRIVSHSLYFGAEPVNGGLYRPLAGAYYTIVGALVGLQPLGYHLAHILLYGLNVATVFLFFGRLSPRPVAMTVVATVLFLVHPIHTEVVNNIKSADEMLCLEFFVLSAMAWLRYADTARPRWRYASIAAYALAVCSKETAVPMMLVLPALWYFFRHRTLRASVTAAIPFAAVGLLFVGARHLLLAREPAANIVTILNNALVSTSDKSVQLTSALAYLGRYLRMLVWPYPMSFDYGFNAIPLRTYADPVVWVAAASLLGLAAVAVAGWRKRRLESFAVLWFAGSMIAVSNVLFLISTNFGERLLYLPSLVACYLAAEWLFRAARIGSDAPLGSVLRSPVIVITALLVVAVSIGVDLKRTREWRSQLTLFAADVRKFPNSVRLNNYFGNLLYFEGERLSGEPGYAYLARTNLVNAKSHLLKGLSISGTFQEMHSALGMSEYKLKDCPAALPYLERAIPFEGSRETAIGMMADCYKQLQTPDKALALFKRLDEQGIVYPMGLFDLANDATARGDDDAAIRYFGRFVAARPENVAAHFNLAAAHRRKNEYQQSVGWAERCVALKPTPDIEAKCLLLGADGLMRLGRAAEAAQHFERAKALDPNNPWIRR